MPPPEDDAEDTKDAPEPVAVAVGGASFTRKGHAFLRCSWSSARLKKNVTGGGLPLPLPVPMLPPLSPPVLLPELQSAHWKWGRPWCHRRCAASHSVPWKVRRHPGSSQAYTRPTLLPVPVLPLSSRGALVVPMLLLFLLSFAIFVPVLLLPLSSALLLLPLSSTLLLLRLRLPLLPPPPLAPLCPLLPPLPSSPGCCRRGRASTSPLLRAPTCSAGWPTEAAAAAADAEDEEDEEDDDATAPWKACLCFSRDRSLRKVLSQPGKGHARRGRSRRCVSRWCSRDALSTKRLPQPAASQANGRSS